MFVYCFHVSIVLISVLLQVEEHNFYFYSSLLKREVTSAPNCVCFQLRTIRYEKMDRMITKINFKGFLIYPNE